jgi:hypothetical protein
VLTQPELAEQLKTVHSRQLHVEQNETETADGRQPKSCRCIGRDGDAVPGMLYADPVHLGHGRVVLDVENL